MIQTENGQHALESEKTHTEREILSQPGLWQEVYDLIQNKSAAIHAFLKPVLQNTNARVVLTGAGTSGYVGESAQGILQKKWRRPVQAVATTEIVTQPEAVFLRAVPTLLISFARSGNSPESVETVRLANACCDEIYHLIITCNAEGALAAMQVPKPDRLYCLLLPEAANDKSLAMTSSFTCLLLSVLLVGHLHAGDQEHVKIRHVAKQGNLILQNRPLLENLAQEGFERVVFLGSGEMLGIARECQLKLLELTDGKQVCMSDSFLGFRHGPRAFVNENTLMVYLFSRNAHILRYERDLAEDIAGDRRKIRSLQIGTDLALPHSSAIVLDLDPENPYQMVAGALVGQLLGYCRSLYLGINPDSPSSSGSISRVVQGVNIYQENDAKS